MCTFNDIWQHGKDFKVQIISSETSKTVKDFTTSGWPQTLTTCKRGRGGEAEICKNMKIALIREV